MRKGGKFADDAVGRAKLWLPPVQEVGKEGAKEKKLGVERRPSWTIDEL